MDVPLRFLDTERVTPDTHVIRQVAGEGMVPVVHYLNSAVVTGAEPVIVDAGSPPPATGGSTGSSAWSTRPTCAGSSCPTTTPTTPATSPR